MANKKTGKNSFFLGCFITILAPVILFVLYVIYTYSTIPSFPKGEFLFASNSPNGTYTIKIYRTNGGATTSYAIRGQLIHNQTKRRKNIYFEYRAWDAEVTWENEHTVVINGKRLNVRKDIYDWRKEK